MILNSEKLDGSCNCRDAELNKRVRRAAEILETYGDTIRSTICFYTNNRTLADDIYQEFFLSLVRRPIRADIENVRRYLIRAVINDILDTSRRTKSHRNLLAGYADFRMLAQRKQMQNDAHKPIIAMDNMNHLIKMAKKHLSRREAESVIMKYRDNLTVTEAAVRMQVKKRTYSRYLCVGLKKIRQFIREQHLGISDFY